jgi:type I restriction enzyme M protein
MVTEKFPKMRYVNVSGLCSIATVKEIEKQNWSLSPGRYVGVNKRPPDEFVFLEHFQNLNEELEMLNLEARSLEERLSENAAAFLDS